VSRHPLDIGAARQRLREAKAQVRTLLTILAGREVWPGMKEPLNGQRARIRAVRTLINDFEPDALIETGTFVGSTTRFFCGNGIPVYTAEMKRSFWLLARLRLGWGIEAKLFRGDTLTMLRRLATERPFKRPLAYLDAHWWGELPVSAELNLLRENWSDAVVVIDDFMVPGDPGYLGYGYNDGYLSLNEQDGVSLPPDARAAYPAVPSDQETGARNGALYVAWGRDGQAALRSLVTTRQLRYAPGYEDELEPTVVGGVAPMS
jgi:hypothetical protein